VSANTTSSSFISQPDIMPKGALVGVTCCHRAQPSHPQWGDSEALVESASFGAPSVNPENLYEAQLALRLGQPIDAAPVESLCQGCAEDVAYDFAFGGAAVGANIDGQDNWVLDRDFTGTDGNNVQLVTETAHPDGPLLALRSSNGRDSVISRQNDLRYAFTPHPFDGVDATVRFDARAGAVGGASGNVFLILNNTTGRDEGIQFGMTSSQFQLRGGRFSSVLQEIVSIPSGWYSRGDWARLELRVNFLQDTASMFFMNLSDADTTFRAIPGLQDVPLEGEVAYPETWDRLEFRIRNEAAATNLIANLGATQKCCELDADNDGMFDGASDLAAFVVQVEAGDALGDFDADGSTDFVDVLRFLDLALTGCL
jgi:hypothetical protein